MNSRLDDTEEHISELEDRIMESTQSEQQKEKTIFLNGNSLRDRWDNIKYPRRRENAADEGCQRG